MAQGQQNTFNGAQHNTVVSRLRIYSALKHSVRTNRENTVICILKGRLQRTALFRTVGVVVSPGNGSLRTEVSVL